MDFSTTTWIIIALVVLLIGAAIWMLLRRPGGADETLDGRDGRDARIADRDATLGDRDAANRHGASAHRDAGADGRTLPEEAQGVTGDERDRSAVGADEPFDQSAYDSRPAAAATTGMGLQDDRAEHADRVQGDRGQGDHLESEQRVGDQVGDGYAEDGAGTWTQEQREGFAEGRDGAHATDTETYADDRAAEGYADGGRQGYSETDPSDEDRDAWRDGAAIGAMGAAGAGAAAAGDGRDDRQLHHDDTRQQDLRGEEHRGDGEVHALTSDEIDAGARQEPLPVEDQRAPDPDEVSGAAAQRDQLADDDRGRVSEDERGRWGDGAAGGAAGGATAATALSGADERSTRDGETYRSSSEGDRASYDHGQEGRGYEDHGQDQASHVDRSQDQGYASSPGGETAYRGSGPGEDRLLGEDRGAEGYRGADQGADDYRGADQGGEDYRGADQGAEDLRGGDGRSSDVTRDAGLASAGAAGAGYAAGHREDERAWDTGDQPGATQDQAHGLRGEDRGWDQGRTDDQGWDQDRQSDQQGWDQGQREDRGAVDGRDDHAAPVDEPVREDHGGSADEPGGAVFAESIYGAGSAEPLEDGSGPAGWEIKGNAGSMLFHTADSPSYDAVRAEVWFENEEAARGAGFAHWDRRRR